MVVDEQRIREAMKGGPPIEWDDPPGLVKRCISCPRPLPLSGPDRCASWKLVEKEKRKANLRESGISSGIFATRRAQERLRKAASDSAPKRRSADEFRW